MGRWLDNIEEDGWLWLVMVGFPLSLPYIMYKNKNEEH